MGYRFNPEELDVIQAEYLTLIASEFAKCENDETKGKGKR
jgi:hypothetical protein